jgi:LmbE family N-acetylglucosaminyl deacetylase
VTLEERGFEWPSDATGDTALLEIHLVESRALAPEIALRRAEVSTVQAFEDGAAGRRFLDVSPFLRSAATGPVSMIGEGARWRTGGARLFTFHNPVAQEIEKLRVLVVAPHPDDAEIGSFGVYSRAVADVVTVTSGDAGAQGFGALFTEPGEHYRVKGWIRTWDSITVPFFGGVVPGSARNLGYYDATLGRLYGVRPRAITPLLAALEHPGWYRELNVDPELKARPFTATWPSLVADLAAELARVNPRVVVAPHPLLDRHRDHQFAALALLEALESWPGDCELWLYTNHAIENEAWPLGPRAAMTGLPPWAGGDLFFSRIYSHPLDDAQQKRKLVALEAMHDLRAFDLRDGEEELVGGRAERESAAREREEEQRYDYFRRAPRPNELFFVLTRDEAARLRASFVARAQAFERLRHFASLLAS